MWKELNKRLSSPSRLKNSDRDPGINISKGIQNENLVTEADKNEDEKYSTNVHPSVLIGDHYFDDAEDGNLTPCMGSSFHPVENIMTAQTDTECDESRGQTSKEESVLDVSNPVNENENEEEIWDLGMDATVFGFRILRLPQNRRPPGPWEPPDLSFLPDESTKIDRAQRASCWVLNVPEEKFPNEEEKPNEKTKLNLAKSVPAIRSTFYSTLKPMINQATEPQQPKRRTDISLAKRHAKPNKKSGVKILSLGSAKLIPLKWQAPKPNRLGGRLQHESVHDFYRASAKIKGSIKPYDCRPYLLCANHIDRKMNVIHRPACPHSGTNPGLIQRSIQWLRRKVSRDTTKLNTDFSGKRNLRIHAFTVSIPDGVKTLSRKIKS